MNMFLFAIEKVSVLRTAIFQSITVKSRVFYHKLLENKLKEIKQELKNNISAKLPIDNRQIQYITQDLFCSYKMQKRN